MAAAASAIGSGDYATAKTHALAALAYLIAMPDGGWRDGAAMDWKSAREAVDKLIAQCDEQLSATTGIQRTKIQYERTSAPI